MIRSSYSRVSGIAAGLVLALALTAAVSAQETLKLSQWLDFERVSGPQISPDGQRIVYTRRWVDKVADKWKSSVWMMNADGSRNRFLLKGSSPKWSPDGERLAYLAEGEPKGQQIFVRWMDAEGGTTQVTRVEKAPRGFEWSPDGEQPAFVQLVPKTTSWKIDMPKPPKGAKWTESPRIVDRMTYRRDRQGFVEEG
jgi:dipeptidyl aminopeptidase/acylaminoacyl peptidase